MARPEVELECDERAGGTSVVGESGGGDTVCGVFFLAAEGKRARSRRAFVRSDFRGGVWICGSGGGGVFADGDGAAWRDGSGGLPTGATFARITGEIDADRGTAGSGDDGDAGERGAAGKYESKSAVGDVFVDVRDLGHCLLRGIVGAGEMAGIAAGNGRVVPDPSAMGGAGVVPGGGERADDGGGGGREQIGEQGRSSWPGVKSAYLLRQ